MKKIKFLIFYFLCSSVFAEDVTVYVNGGILAQSCNISSDNLIKNVNFSDFDPRDFNYIGATSPSQLVSIHLKDCTGNVDNISYQFSGMPDIEDSSLLKILGKSDGSEGVIATGLAIEILDKNKQKVVLNTLQPLNEIITASDYEFNFYLRYKSTSNQITPGDASSILYLDIYYE